MSAEYFSEGVRVARSRIVKFARRTASRYVDRTRLAELEATIDRLVWECSQLRLAFESHEFLVPALQNASGQLVVSWYRGVLASRGNADVSLRPASLIEWVDSDAGHLALPGFDRFILPSLRTTRQWEAEEAAYLRSIVHPGMTVLNVGANVGYSALLMAGQVGDRGLVVAIEPDPLNFHLLSLNIAHNRVRNVLPIHAAAGEATGSIRLQRSPDNTGDHRTANHPLGVAPIEVPLVAIDDLIPPEREVDVVMIDAQGYDHRVVQGMTRTIAAWRPQLVLEFWPPGILEVGDDPEQVLSDYRELGYEIFLLPDQNASRCSVEEILSAGPPLGRDHVTLCLRPTSPGVRSDR